MKIGYRVACEADTHVQATVSQALKKGDVQIAISYSGSKKEIVLCAEAARKQGRRYHAITSLADSPLRRLAHFTLDTVSGETEWRSSWDCLPARRKILLPIYCLLVLCNSMMWSH